MENSKMIYAQRKDFGLGSEPITKFLKVRMQDFNETYDTTDDVDLSDKRYLRKADTERLKNEPLKFTNLGNSKGYLDIYATNLQHDVTLSFYNLDGSGKWETDTFGPTGHVKEGARVHCNANDYILIKGDNEYISSSTSDFLYITGDSDYSSDFAISGSIMSLLGEYVKDVPCNYCFYRLFSAGATNHFSTLDVSELKLPSKKITPYCFYGLFRNQENLTEPIFPSQKVWPKSLCPYYIYGTGVEEYEIEFTADDLGQLQYFSGNCASLTKAKITAHGATTRQEFAYLFQNCTSLTEVILDCEDFDGQDVCKNMFQGVTTTGVLYVRPELVENEVINAAIPETWTIKAIGE